MLNKEASFIYICRRQIKALSQLTHKPPLEKNHKMKFISC